MAQVNLDAVRQRHPEKRRLLTDCIKIQQLMEAGGYDQALARLEADITAYFQRNGTLKKALTTALRNAEVSCGLNPSAPIYMRFLSAEEFGTYGGQGMLFKDVGAGYLHGEYTHRLHWYVIFHAMSSNFTQDVKSVAPRGWNHTPRELLIEINTAGIQLKDSDWPMGPEGNQGFWDALFDRGPGLHPAFDPSTDGISNPEIFSAMLMDKVWLKQNHNALHQGLKGIDQMPNYQNCYGSLSATYPNLSRIVTQRYAKRETQQLYNDKGAYIAKKVKQSAPKTVYKVSPLPLKKGDLPGVLEMKIAEEKQQGHCFLTTACVASRGLPDDCEELQVLRAFRDGYLSQRPGGPELIQEYYALAPRIVEQVQRRGDARAIWDGVYETLRTVLEHIRRGEPEAALRTYEALVKGLSARG